MADMMEDGEDSRDRDSSPLMSKESKHSMRPQDTAWRQQRIKSWSPMITAPWTIPFFFLITVIFAVIGAFLLYTSSQIQELIIDYSHCLAANNSMVPIPRQYYTAFFHTPLTEDDHTNFRWRGNPSTQTCTLQFTIPSNMTPPVLFRYKLTNMHANHRRFVMSLDSQQLMGEARTVADLNRQSSTNLQCKPLVANEEGKPYYPCGEIANAMFNDTFHSPVLLNSNIQYSLTSRGIAWPQDRDLYRPTTYNPADIVPPPFWAERFPDGYNSSNIPNLQEWEEFHVWMRPAGLSLFSRLAKRNDADVLRPGVWQMNITSRFEVLGYNGRKAVVMSTSSVMGGRGSALGWAYVAVAAACAAVGVGLSARVIAKPRQLGDPAYLSWNKPDCYVTKDGSESGSLWERWVNYCHKNGFP